MELEVNNALFLSKQRSHEAKIASLLVGIQVFEMKSTHTDDFVREVFLSQLVTNVSIEFVRDMILCPNPRLQDIAISVLSKLVSVSHLLQKFCRFDQMIQTLAQLYVSSTHRSSSAVSQPDLLMLLQALIGPAPRDTVRAVLHQLLLSGAAEASQQSRILETLELLSYCCVCLGSSEMRTERLSSPHAAALRGLFVQGIHGASPTADREQVFACLASLLQPQSLALDPCWTVEEGKDTTVGQFSRLLSSVVAGELHLWVEECLDGTAPGSDETGESHSQRSEMVRAMIGTLLSLVDSMQFLLVGPRCDDDEVEDPGEGAWAGLPSSVLLQIQTNLHHCVAECFDYTKWCAMNSAGQLQPDPLTLKSAQTLCAWVAEDDQLHPSFPAQLDVLLQLCTGYSCLLSTKSQAMRSMAELCRAHEVARGAASSDQTHDDVALYLFPCVLAVFGTALESEEELAERVLGATNLLSVAMHTVCVFLASDGSSDRLSNQSDTLFEASCDLIECIMELKRSDILALLPAEGLSAIGYVLGYELEPLLVTCLYESLTKITKPGAGKWSALVMQVSDQLLNTMHTFIKHV